MARDVLYLYCSMEELIENGMNEIGSWLENGEPKKALSKIIEAIFDLRIKRFRAALKAF